MESAIQITPRRVHLARLMAIWRSAGWPCRDAIELDLVAAGWATLTKYKDSVYTEKRAKALALDARRAQANLPATELAARQAACLEEGSKLFLAASGLERAVVSRFATQRMERLVGK